MCKVNQLIKWSAIQMWTKRTKSSPTRSKRPCSNVNHGGQVLLLQSTNWHVRVHRFWLVVHSQSDSRFSQLPLCSVPLPIRHISVHDDTFLWNGPNEALQRWSKQPLLESRRVFIKWEVYQRFPPSSLLTFANERHKLESTLKDQDFQAETWFHTLVPLDEEELGEVLSSSEFNGAWCANGEECSVNLNLKVTCTAIKRRRGYWNENDVGPADNISWRNKFHNTWLVHSLHSKSVFHGQQQNTHSGQCFSSLSMLANDSESCHYIREVSYFENNLVQRSLKDRCRRSHSILLHTDHLADTD